MIAVNPIQKTLVITDLKFDNWVLGGNARDITALVEGPNRLLKVDFLSASSRLIALFSSIWSPRLIFVNQNTYFRFWMIANLFRFMSKRIIVLYTHSNSAITNREKHLLNSCEKIVVLNNSESIFLKAAGIRCTVDVQPTGVDLQKFKPGYFEKTQNSVLLVSSFAERKNPLLTLALVSNSPDYNFTLVGKEWDRFEFFEDLLSCTNFNYVEYSYSEYIKCLQASSIFLSLSIQEGGPLPLLESMACDLIPVVTDTGYAPDLIQDGLNGFLISTKCDLEEVRIALDKAAHSNFSTRGSVESFSYQNYLQKFRFE